MIELKTPRGLDVHVPETDAEDQSPKFDLADIDGFKAYYEENGYAIVRNLFSAEQCQTIRGLWDQEVKPFDGFMYRQATAKAEKHVKNENGWIMNPILNLQSVDPTQFPRFRDFASRQVLANARLRTAFAKILGASPKVVQSMYFEGNSETWEHQDTYYLDSETVGEMCAAWIAVEDIAARAGRFFICPGSHKIRLADHSLYNNISENHEGYIASVVALVRERKLPIRAPKMNRGDVLFWNSWTIHGSLASQDAKSSRSSITCHAIPEQKKFLQLQTRLFDLKTDKVNNVDIFRPKDLTVAKNRAILFVESHFPSVFYWFKKRAILYFIRRKAQLS